MKILHSSRSSRVTLPLVFIPENCQQSLDQIRLPLMWDQGPVKPGREWREKTWGGMEVEVVAPLGVWSGVNPQPKHCSII